MTAQTTYGGRFALALTIIIGAVNFCAAQMCLAVPTADSAIVLAIDVSNSVSPENYTLQMEGVAAALEDPEVLATIAGGPHGGIFLSIVTWSSKARIVLPWTRINTRSDASDVARHLRALPRDWTDGEATCLATMLETVRNRLLLEIAGKTFRTVVDVSGDGKDNCSQPGAVAAARDVLVSRGVTINGLPIVPSSEELDAARIDRWKLYPGAETLDAADLEKWYGDHVRGGPRSFILTARGFGDFARAFRNKFIIEISGTPGEDHIAGPSHLAQAP